LIDWLICSGEESEELTNDEVAEGSVMGHHSSQPLILGCDGNVGDISDDLYTEINSRDTDRLLKSHVSSKTRRATAAASNSESSSVPFYDSR